MGSLRYQKQAEAPQKKKKRQRRGRSTRRRGRICCVLTALAGCPASRYAVLNTWRTQRWIPTISLGMCCSIQCDKKVTDTSDLRWNWKWKIIIFLTPNTTVWTAADINTQNVTAIISEFRHYVTNQFYLYGHTLDVILKVYLCGRLS